MNAIVETRVPRALVPPSRASFAHPESLLRSFSLRELDPGTVLALEPGGQRRSFAARHLVVGDAAPFERCGFSDGYAEGDYYLLRLAGAEVLTDRMYVATADGLMRETAGRVFHAKLARAAEDPRAVDIDADALVVGNYHYQNYYHWLFQGLSVILDAQHRGGPLPTLLVPPLNGWRRESLELVGVDPDACVELHENTVVRPGVVLYSCFSTEAFSLCPHARLVSLFDRFAERVAAEQDGPRDELVYISRANSARRKLVNEPELIQALSERGFVEHRLEDLSLSQQIVLFRNAEHVVAPHGAGLANLLFAGRCRSVTEIFPTNYVNRCFFHICQAKGIDHHAVAATVLNDLGAHESSARVDLAVLDAHVHDTATHP